MLITRSKLNEINLEADQYILDKDYDLLDELINRLINQESEFDHPIDEAHFLYTIANCYSEIYDYRRIDWYSDDLMKSIIFYRKALYVLPENNWNDNASIVNASKDLRSMILTNLANNLSSQGRVLRCIPLYDQAISINEKIEAFASKARNNLFLAESLYDDGHRGYHYFVTYKLILYVIDNLEELYPEARPDFLDEGELFRFKEWFSEEFDLSSFDYFKDKYEFYDSRKEKDYLTWCSKNHLFINDLNDVCEYEISYQDVFTLPSFSTKINSILTMQEELSYHGNFDEIKNDYCYARYLFFSANSIPENSTHFFNSTYPHVDDMSYAINNLKTAHYKSAFRVLYSLFDKIAYLISRFFDLNDIKEDHKLSIDNLFKDFNYQKSWKPHKKLKDSDNHFIHALFYILKDIRDVKNSSSVSEWIDPDAEAFSKIRNAMEHRSLKIVDDFGYELVNSSNRYQERELDSLNEEISITEKKLLELRDCLVLEKRNHENHKIKLFEENEHQLSLNLLDLESKLYEKKKLSSHSLLIPISQFEKRLMTLMKLSRNSIMYLSLALHFEEKKKPKYAVCMPMEVPLKNNSLD